MSLSSCLYRGIVMHQRVRPHRHRLRYSVFSVLVDLDELPTLSRRLRLFSHNRLNVFSLYDRDHGPSDGRPLRAWVDNVLADAGFDLCGGPIRMLAYPRILGYVFNPLSVYFCYRNDGALAVILYEVRNTFGQQHSYLIPVEHGEPRLISQACDKCFYVSPFIAVAGRYNFKIEPPDETLSVVVNLSDDDGALLHAAFRGTRAPMTDRSLATCFARYPLMTLKVIAGIHWEALKLWRKGVPLVDRPPPPSRPVTLVTAQAQ